MPDSLLNALKALFDGWEKNAALLAFARTFLIHGYWWWLTVLALLTAPFFLSSLVRLVGSMRAVKTGTWVWLFWIFNAGAAMRLFWTMRLPQVFYDEISFLHTSRSLAQWGLNNLAPLSGDPSVLFLPCPVGWQYLVALVFKAAGVDVAYATNLSCLLSCLDVLLVFLAVYLLFDDERWAVGSALLAAVHPVLLRLSGSVALENGSLLFLALALLFLGLYLRTRAGADLVSFLLCLGWLGNMRMENSFVLVPLLVSYLIMRDPDRRATFRNPLFWCGLLVMAVSLFPALLSDWYGLATRFYFFHESRELMKSHIAMNYAHNARYWVENRIHPALFTALGIAGFIALVRTKLRRPEALFWLSWFVLLYVYYSANPSCDFALFHTLDSWRNALHPLVALLVLGGAGFAAVISLVPRLQKILMPLLVIALFLVPAQFAGFVHTLHPWMRQFSFQQSVAHLVPESALLLIDGDFSREVQGYNLATSTEFSMGMTPLLLSLNERFLQDVYQWRAMEKRRVFIYYLSFESDWDTEHLTALLDRVETILVAREKIESHGYSLSFNLLEVKGLKKPYEKRVLDE